MPQSSYGTGFGFTGEYTDANDLLYLRARYYAPEMGVFTALDPWEGKTCTPMSLNGYSWVEGNIINITDPTGLSPASDFTCFLAATACVTSLVFVADNVFGVGFAVDATFCTFAAGVCGTAKLIDVVQSSLGRDAADFLATVLSGNNSQSTTGTSDPITTTDEIVQSLGSSSPPYNPTLLNDPFSLCRLLNLGVCGLGYDNSAPPIEYPWYVPSRNFGIEAGIETLMQHIVNIVGWDVGGYSPKPNPDDRDRPGWCRTVKRTIENIQNIFSQQSEAQIIRNMQNLGIYNNYNLDDIEYLLDYIVEQEICDDHWGGWSPTGFSFPR